jgi:hypothetical protein
MEKQCFTFPLHITSFEQCGSLINEVLAMEQSSQHRSIANIQMQIITKAGYQHKNILRSDSSHEHNGPNI